MDLLRPKDIFYDSVLKKIHVRRMETSGFIPSQLNSMLSLLDLENV